MRWLFTVLALLACTITLPVDTAYNMRHNPQGKTILSMLTVQDVEGDSLFVHVVHNTFSVGGYRHFFHFPIPDHTRCNIVPMISAGSTGGRYITSLFGILYSS